MQGNLFLSKYKEKIDGFKGEFDSKMNAFDRSVSLETFKSVDRIDETVHNIREFAQSFLTDMVDSDTTSHFS